MKKLIIVNLAIFISALVQAQDFDLEKKVVQKVSLDGIKNVLISCYCSGNIEEEPNKSNKIILHIEASHSSSGYHGVQDIPTEIPKSLTDFKVERDKVNLKLSSNEYTFIHHAYIIKSLKISLPPGVNLIIDPIKVEDLEGR